MSWLLRRPALTLIVTALAIVSWRPATSQTERHIHLTAVDSEGQPVTDLVAGNLEIDLGGVRQEVIAVAPARTPVSVMILTDRLGLNPSYSAHEVGTVLKAFVSRLRGAEAGVSVALTTFDGPVMRVKPFGTGPLDLDRALERLATSSRTAAFLEGLADATQSFVSAPTSRRVIFAVLSAYRPDQSEIRNTRVAEMLRLSGASLWAVEVREIGPGNVGNAVREEMLDLGSELSGGARVTVTSPHALAEAVQGMAGLIAAQYRVTYGPGDGARDSQLTVRVTRPGVAVLAPHWIDRPPEL